MKRYLFFILLVVVDLSGCTSASGTLTMSDAWARPAFKGDNGAVYFVIENGTNTDDLLLGASADTAKFAEAHMTMANNQGVVTMQMQEAVQIPAGEDITFKPGGLHIMLVNLNRDLKIGDTLTLTLKFKNAGEIKLQVEVKEQP